MTIPGWSLAKMVELGEQHAAVEAQGDLTALLETLAPDPLYEFHPLGRCMRGDAMVRRFYEHFIENFLPLRAETELIGQWASEREVVQEYRLDLEIDGAKERHHVVGILYVDEASAVLGKLKGERVYASKRFIQLMTGPIFDELAPLV